ncbi:L,D-transpeptidase family protein [Bilifractor sp. LCP19S3_H10]|uniref:L,D-transpeptidase family protein n=1 Tax=Bilifractor sp. LCP19S3_H10 TaxID=3438736 RepID=UPI003F92FC5B
MGRKNLLKLVTTLTAIGVISAACPVYAEDTAASYKSSETGETDDSLDGTSGSAENSSDAAENNTVTSADNGVENISSENTGTPENGTSSEEDSGEKAGDNTVTDASNESVEAEIVGTDSVSGSSESASATEESTEEKREETEEKDDALDIPVVSYAAHVQRTGWPDKDVVSGENTQTYAGSTGKGLRVEAIRASVKGDQNLGITYNTYVQRNGWTGWQSDGAAAGTTGQSLRVEAIVMKLTGTDAEKYDLYYRVHVQSFGWLAWAKNGELAGTTNLSRRVEAYEVAIVKKGEAAPARSAARNVAYLTVPTVTYQTHVQKYGWSLGEVSNGATGGTTGQGLRMEALKIHLGNTTGFTGGISYCSHIQRAGWEKEWKADGVMTGTVGKRLRLEAIRIRLTGEMANLFDVYYRTHVQRFGWTGWACNGENCGSAGYGYRMEAIEIRIVAKGSGAPGSTANTFWKYVNPHAGMDAIAQGYSSSTGYLLMVDRSAHRTGVYTGSRNNWQNQKYWLCSNGKASTPTITGVYRLGIKGLYFWSGNTKCWYYSQISGDYLFHSVIYDGSSSPVRILDGTLGAATSHGCVRLALENAKYIYDNVPYGTTVVIYN